MLSEYFMITKIIIHTRVWFYAIRELIRNGGFRCKIIFARSLRNLISFILRGTRISFVSRAIRRKSHFPMRKFLCVTYIYSRYISRMRGKKVKISPPFESKSHISVGFDFRFFFYLRTNNKPGFFYLLCAQKYRCDTLEMRDFYYGVSREMRPRWNSIGKHNPPNINRNALDI